MKNSKKIYYCLLFIVFVSICFFLLFALLKTDNINNSNLILEKKIFQFPKNAEIKFQEQLKKNNLKKIFIKDRLNFYSPTEKWSGRIKYAGISYQALFSLNSSKITVKLKNLLASGLSFSIYNPKNSRLFYNIIIKTKNQKIPLFKGYYDQELLIQKEIPLKRQFKEEVELIFKTKGKGLGAWVNPHLMQKKIKPKIFLVIVLDTLRYDHTSLYGYFRITTPNLDQLAREAVVYKNAYTSTSWTLPAHVSLFTGKNLNIHGVLTPNDKISIKNPLIAEVFQKEGFLTAAFTGGGFVEDSFGFARGFQIYSNNPGRTFSMNSSERVFQHFKDFLEREWGNDLFVFLHTYQMHAPYKAPHQFIDQINPDMQSNLKGIRNYIRESSEYYKNISPEQRQLLINLYDASILYADQMLVGEIVKLLKKKGVYNDTMLVILSDHGEEFYDHQSWEHGHTLYKELVKIPLVVKYPHSKKIGEESALASITDIPGIILHESGLEYNKEEFKNEIGKDKRIIPILLPLSPIIKQFPPKISLLNKNHHFIFNVIDQEALSFFNPSVPPQRLKEIELYNMNDYLEKNNIYNRRKKTAKWFFQQMEKYLKRIKGIKIDQFKGDKDLEEKLKSLGYLGN